MSKMVFRGNVYMIDLGNPSGSIQGGVRPCVVVSNDINNAHSPTIQVIPLTSVDKNELPVHFKLDVKGHKFLSYDSTALTEQFTTINKYQVVQYIGTLEKSDVDKILKRLDIQLGRNT